jgi:hypothetical protein
MRATLSRFLIRLASFLAPRGKGMPFALAGGQWSGTSFVDSYRRNRKSIVLTVEFAISLGFIRFRVRKRWNWEIPQNGEHNANGPARG